MTYKILPNGLLLFLYIQPGASVTGLAGLFGDPARIKLKVHAPPRDGEANAEVISFMAKKFGIKKTSLEIIRGEKGRQKDLQLSVSKEESLRIIEIIEQELS
ncbi:MAG: DUF167 domain-containing protein [Bacteriovoracaceae bacterium]|nr:DUF167 domain-containing protein [Bacteriovoracaceae bacterium]